MVLDVSGIFQMCFAIFAVTPPLISLISGSKDCIQPCHLHSVQPAAATTPEAGDGPEASGSSLLCVNQLQHLSSVDQCPAAAHSHLLLLPRVLLCLDRFSNNLLRWRSYWRELGLSRQLFLLFRVHRRCRRDHIYPSWLCNKTFCLVSCFDLPKSVNVSPYPLWRCPHCLFSLSLRHQLLKLWFSWVHLHIHPLLLPTTTAKSCTAAASTSAAATAAAAAPAPAPTPTAALDPGTTQAANKFFLEQLGKQHGDGPCCEHLQKDHFSPEQVAKAQRASQAAPTPLLWHLQD